MKVIVDWDLCEANAVCMARCPEVFRVGGDDQLVLLVERPAESLRAKVEAAVQGCPRHALRLAEE
jgi:ferredoxin